MTPLRRFASSPKGTPPVARQSRFHGSPGWLAPFELCWFLEY